MAYVFLAAGLFLIFGIVYGIGREMARDMGWWFVIESFLIALLVVAGLAAGVGAIWAGVSLL